MTAEVERWGPGRVDELTELVRAAFPAGEALTADELATVLWEDPSGPGVVLGTRSGDGVVAAVTRPFGGDVMGHVRLIAVAPSAQRQGLGTELLAAAEAWLTEQGAGVVRLGGEAPVYLWPGVDTSWVGAQCLLEAAGYVSTGCEINMELSSSYRRSAPEGVELRRLEDDDDVAAVSELVERCWPSWLVELDLGVEQATVHGAFAEGRAVGFCAHSVLRFGWLGPMGTDPQWRGRGAGGALVAAACEDLQVAGRSTVEISWVGPVRFYAKLGATVTRTFTLPTLRVLGTATPQGSA